MQAIPTHQFRAWHERERNDPDAAPEGKSGLIVSFLFDYELTRRIEADGWYGEFEQRIRAMMIDTLTQSVYHELKEHILFSFTASPLSIERGGEQFRGGHSRLVVRTGNPHRCGHAQYEESRPHHHPRPLSCWPMDR
jgi:hypothetical protein